MKKYVLPTLISLAIGSSWAIAEEVTPPPAVEQAPVHSTNEEMMKIRQAHRQYMQEQMEKIRQTQDPEKRQQLIQEQMQEAQRITQEMQTLMQNNAPPTDMDYGRPPYWNGPNYGYYGRQYPRLGYGGPRAYSRHYQSKKSHCATVESSLANIESLLKQILDNQLK